MAFLQKPSGSVQTALWAFYIVFLISSCSSTSAEELPSFVPGDFFVAWSNADGVEKVLDYPPGSAYLAGRYAQVHLADNVDPIPFYLLSLEHEEAPYATEAARRLVEILTSLSVDDSENQAPIERILQALNEPRQPDRTTDRMLARWYYEQQLDHELIPLIEHMNCLYGSYGTDPEVLLWSIVADIRSENTMPQGKIRALNRNFRA